ncbi:MAG TPA: PAS domain-containing sensor histidine kinase [Candidatus Nitrosotalea sp.]|nr:PAS domain-containing sensor histidine kinase [Candidatus Nitrosotalea sp.]
MNTLGTVGGLLIAILGLAVIDIGINPEDKFSNQVFSLGVAGIVIGGIVMWTSNKRQKRSILDQKYHPESSIAESTGDVRYRTLYENSPVLQRTVDTNGIIIECNQAYVKNFGNSKSDVVGRSLFDHTAERSLGQMQRTFETWKATGRAENDEIWFKRKDGTVFPGLISANNIHDAKGRLIGSNTVIREISEIYQARKVLEENERRGIQLEEIKKMESLKDDFFMTVSKEFQVPIEPIKKYCAMLNDLDKGNLNSKQIEAINGIYNSTVRLEQLIQDIVDVQKLESKRMEFTKENFEADAFMKEVVSMCTGMMQEKRIAFENLTTSKQVIKSDKKRLAQVLYNLIQNAVDFVPSKGGKIEIAAKEGENSFLFYVKDNGSGISEKRKPSIFKKFYQVDVSMKRRYGGSGFGLVICKGVVDNLGGEIWFESKEAEGTTFYFSIPR